MRYRGFAILFVLSLALFLFTSKPAFSQDQARRAKSEDNAPTPRTPDGHPDLNGLWNNADNGNLNPDTRQFEKSQDGSELFDFSLGYGGGGKPECTDDTCQASNQPPYKPEYMEKAKAIASTFNGNSTPLDPEMQCKPWGIPRGGIGGNMQIVQTDKVIAILYEGHPQPSSVYRIIYMNSDHPSDLDASYLGDSRGHWDGDTLVVDVTGLNDETWLGGNGRAKYTTIHSNKEHVVERWTRKGNAITYEATVDDPVMFTKPWTMAPKQIYLDTLSDDQLLELFCTPEATGGGHFVKPSAQEQKNHCEALGKEEYDSCVKATSNK